MELFKPLYPCDPKKNVECKKDMCFMYGGECRSTTDPEYAKKPDDPKEKRLQFRSWEELLQNAHSYTVLGYEVEVRGWDDMSNNILTVRDPWEEQNGSRTKGKKE